jgi:hypothetical protein
MIGGLWRATEADLAATLDCLSLADGPASEKSLARARDLLVSYARRGCELHQKAHGGDKTSLAAAESLRTLLLRTADTRLAAVIRREAAKAVDHAISADAVRHREDKIIEEIAADVFADLQQRRGDEPQSIEAALHHLVPVLADVREDLHDGLCVVYDGVQPADAHERRVIDGFYRQTVIKLGQLLVRSTQLAKVGLQSSDMTADEFWFVARARNLNAFLFDGVAGDRDYMVDFMRTEGANGYNESADKLLSIERGRELYDRWVEWVQSCYPTCAFERSTDVLRMCNPHGFLTLLYDVEIRYRELGYRDLQLPETPMIHHRL